ncbi:hypothetical protein GCM10010168_17080 [Actinoplanes ianthinogenes]|uniref:Ricin B lectin domain-containing protein n=1 Tax=Actinoplanes ianthinogenes TaxID=122358 RepID=A0ABM7M015_9ACTN|nr:RICIN domain-containing protein [Actinoplanes ianthinogenes]BCJ44895.1 hypothetical protein Aiant_55520 [Actinoplanes ianthinogenes]GGR00653.1 hypothetical protein GCM10010168_17080 [Actinoplanes ianthinogenes]
MRMRRVLAALTAGVAALVGVVLAPASPASAATYTAYVSILTPNGNIGPSVIDIPRDHMNDGVIAQLWILRSGKDVDNQRWNINRITNLSAPFGKFQFANSQTGKCLTDYGPPFDDHTVRQYTCTTSTNQWWQAVRVSSSNANWVELVNMNSGRCLDSRGYGYGNGVVLQTYPCHGDWNQRFNPYP